MTRIYDTDTHEVVELELVTDGQDFLAEVIAGSDQNGHWLTDRDDADFEMDDMDLSWWENWAKREQRINDTAQALGEDAIEMLCGLANQYGHDMELLQDESEKALGIEAM